MVSDGTTKYNKKVFDFVVFMEKFAEMFDIKMQKRCLC